MDTVSALEANKYDFSRCDFIITTVPINVKKVHWILVNPLLLEEDKDKIKTIMTKIPLGFKSCIQNPFQNQKRPDRPAHFRGTVWPQIQLTGFMLAGSSTGTG